MLPIPGTSSVEHLEENVATASLRLTDEDYQMFSCGLHYNSPTARLCSSWVWELIFSSIEALVATAPSSRMLTSVSDGWRQTWAKKGTGLYYERVATVFDLAEQLPEQHSCSIAC
jgi:hypothetical protein